MLEVLLLMKMVGSLTEPNKKYDPNRYFQFEGFVYKEGQRNIMRNYLGLNPILDQEEYLIIRMAIPVDFL